MRIQCYKVCRKIGHLYLPFNKVGYGVHYDLNIPTKRQPGYGPLGGLKDVENVEQMLKDVHLSSVTARSLTKTVQMMGYKAFRCSGIESKDTHFWTNGGCEKKTRFPVGTIFMDEITLEEEIPWEDLIDSFDLLCKSA